MDSPRRAGGNQHSRPSRPASEMARRSGVTRRLYSFKVEPPCKPKDGATSASACLSDPVLLKGGGACALAVIRPSLYGGVNSSIYSHVQAVSRLTNEIATGSRYCFDLASYVRMGNPTKHSLNYQLLADFKCATRPISKPLRRGHSSRGPASTPGPRRTPSGIPRN
jgi:hypothetical protein